MGPQASPVGDDQDQLARRGKDAPELAQYKAGPLGEFKQMGDQRLIKHAFGKWQGFGLGNERAACMARRDLMRAHRCFTHHRKAFEPGRIKPGQNGGGMAERQQPGRRAAPD